MVGSAHALEQQILLDVDYALNVQDYERPRQEALVAHLGVRPQLWGRLAAVEGPQAWGPVAWAPLPTQMWTPLSPPPWDREVHKELKQRQVDAIEGARAADRLRVTEGQGSQAGYRQPSAALPRTTRSRSAAAAAAAAAAGWEGSEGSEGEGS